MKKMFFSFLFFILALKGRPATYEEILAQIQVLVGTTPAQAEPQPSAPNQLPQQQIQPAPAPQLPKPPIPQLPAHHTTNPAPYHNPHPDHNYELMQNITATLLPLTINATIAKILAQDATTVPFDDQLDTVHIAAAFLTKLTTKLEGFSPQALEYLKSKQFAEHPLAKKLFQTVLALQSLFDERLETYKGIKPQPTIVKELKKVVVQQKKILDTIIRDTFGIN